MSPGDLPFELTHAHRAWRGTWQEKKLRVVLSGDAGPPDPARLATLRNLVTRWPEVQARIEDFLRGLEGHIPLDPPELGGFAVESCGFDQSLGYCAILVETEDPAVAVVLFDTGFPDGYAMYQVELRDGEPFAVSAFAS